MPALGHNVSTRNICVITVVAVALVPLVLLSHDTTSTRHTAAALIDPHLEHAYISGTYNHKLVDMHR